MPRIARMAEAAQALPDSNQALSVHSHEAQSPLSSLPMLRGAGRAKLPMRWGSAEVCGFEASSLQIELMAILYGDWQRQNVTVHLHAGCLWGDALGSLLCGCGEALEQSMHAIQREGAGIVAYAQRSSWSCRNAPTRHGSGDALKRACKALTPEEFSACVAVLRELGVTSISVLQSISSEEKLTLLGNGIHCELYCALESSELRQGSEIGR
jgi:GTP cyclohydrolase II